MPCTVPCSVSSQTLSSRSRPEHQEGRDIFYAACSGNAAVLRKLLAIVPPAAVYTDEVSPVLRGNTLQLLDLAICRFFATP